MQATEMTIWIVFIISSFIYWWVGKSVISQPTFNIPKIFRNQFSGKAVIILPQLGFLAVVISGFVFTDNGWWHLGAVIVAVVFLSSRPQSL